MRPIKHGMSRTRLYRCWADMKTRCINQKQKWYPMYGGRGIKVCDEWLEYEPFAAWALTNGYRDDLTIDRINNDGDYTPENYRWSSQREQSLNKRHLPSKTGYVGVRKHSNCDKYVAEVWDHQKRHYVGLFPNPQEASRARTEYIKHNNLQRTESKA